MLLDKARSQQPTGAKGDEAEVWKTFIGILDLRARGSALLARAARSGDLSRLDIDLARLNSKTRTLNNRFNHALAAIRDVEPPPDEVGPPATVASATALNEFKGRMDAIDRRIVASNNPRSVDELRAMVRGWRAAVADYEELLAVARPVAQRAYRLPRANDLGLSVTWRTFLAMIQDRANGMSESASLFDDAIAARAVSPEMQDRLQRLKERGAQLNAQFERVANRLNQNLDSG